MIKLNKVCLAHLSKLIFLSSVLLILLACGQPEEIKEKHYTIGIINPNATNTDITRGFKEEMTNLGYEEGKNTTFITHAVPENLSEAANDLVARDVDLIFVFTTPATKKVKAATQKNRIPVVFAVYDPLKSGLINSLTEPGSNLTGIQIRGSGPKSLEWLLTLAPDIKKIFIPVKFDTQAAKQDISDIKKTAKLFGVQVFTAEVNTLPELDAALSSIPENIDALYLTRSIFIISNVKRIIEEAIKRKLPIGSSTSMYKHGATITYGVKSTHVGRQAARIANMILHGNNPGTIPTELADYFLGINLQTAGASGIEVSNEILLNADTVIALKKKPGMNGNSED